MQRLLAIVSDSVEFAPTLVVWLVDISPSAMQWGSEIHSDVRQFYTLAVPQLNSAQPDRLQSVLITIGRQAEEVVPRTSDPQLMVRALDALRMEASGQEVTFQAVRAALQSYLSVRREERREVLLVIITDEAGDDWKQVDALTEEPRKYALPIYVVGVPAPFGRLAALDPSVEAGSERSAAADPPATTTSHDAWRPIRQGPESRYLERIALAFDGFDSGLELLDSGFGPFALQRLCQESGGELLAVRRPGERSYSPTASRRSWPTADIVPYDRHVMRRYAPDMVDEAGYQQLLSQNRACLALHQAAQLPPAEILRNPELHFVKRDEADLKNRLDRAQQAAAKVAPAVDQLYEILAEGAADAERLTSPRWRAGFELALGRVCAAKARIDGYNSMLAALKRGKAFEKADSTTWVLQRSDKTRSSSALENLAERARTLLRRVAEEHQGTPWAQLAAHELETPLGWEWTEQP